MTKTEAENILKPFKAYKEFPLFEMGQIFTAYGYLECWKQMQPLIEAVKEMKTWGSFSPSTRYRMAKAEWILAQFEEPK